jgi:5-methylcytosine-specific restriction endonuclease McrA
VTVSKKDVRAAFRDAVFARDRYTCVVCGKRWTPADADPSLRRINAHHVVDRHEFPNGGYVAANGVTVCDGEVDSCHMKCEQYHISGGKSWVEGLHPEDLYRKIGSSLDDAIAEDEALAG